VLFSGVFSRVAQPAALDFAHEMRSTRNGTKDVDCGAAATLTATSAFLRYAWRRRRRRSGKSSARATTSGRWVVGGSELLSFRGRESVHKPACGT